MPNQSIFVKRISSPFKTITITFLILLLQGCIGIGVSWVGDVSTTTQVPTLSNKKMLFSEKGQPLSSDYVISQWGEPDHRKRIDDGSEIWEYRGNHLRWHGGFLMLLLPLPLAVPFGHNYATLVIQNGQVQSSTQTYSRTKFEYFCGYTIFRGSQIGCF